MIHGCGSPGSDNKTEIVQSALEELVENKIEMDVDALVSQTNSIIANPEQTSIISTSDRLRVRAIATALSRLNKTAPLIEVLSTIRNYSIFHDDLSLLAEANERLGRTYQNMLQLEVADFYFAQAFELYLELEDMTRLGEVAVSRAYNMIQRGLYEDASKKLDLVYPIYNDLDNYSAIAAIEGTRSMIFNRIKDDERSFYHARRAIQNAILSGDDQRVMGLYGNIGILFRNSIPDSSLYYYRIAEKMAVERGDEGALLRNRVNIANIYSDQGKIEKALELFTELEQESVKLQNQQGILLTRFSIAKLKAMAGEYDLSDMLLDDVFNEMDEQGLVMLKLSSMEEMIEVYEAMGRVESLNRLATEVEAIKNIINEDELRLKLSQASLLQSLQEMDSELSILREEKVRKEFWANVWITVSLLLLIAIVLSSVSYLLRFRRLQAEKAKQIEKIKSKLSGQNSEILKSQLRQVMEEDKLFTNQQLKVEDLCKITGVNRNTLIQAIKDSGWSGFNEYLNNYRVEEMKLLLVDPEKENYSLDYLYKEAGFGSKQSFYKNFKEITGMSPGKWRETYVADSLSK